MSEPTNPQSPKDEAPATDPFPALNVDYCPERNELKAKYQGAGSAISVNNVQLQESLAYKGFQGWNFNEPALAELLYAIKHGSDYDDVIGCQLNASVSIKISTDKMRATASAVPAKGGRALDAATILSALADAGITEDYINHEAIQSFIAAPDNESLVLAKGVQAGTGVPSRFEQLQKSDEEASKPQENEQGVIDYKNIHTFVVVSEGDPLVERIPAIQGTPGYNLLGEIMPAPELNDVSFPKKLDGVKIDPNNENILVAATSGHPVFNKDGVHVDPVLQLPSVNLHSGNINFTGSIFIKGDVESGFTVKASGDITINGSLIKAKVIAGGSVTVKEGIIGDDKSATKNPDTKADKKPTESKTDASKNITPEPEKEFSAQVIANHNIAAKFINLAKIQCAGDVNVREYLLNSDVSAKGFVRLGQSGGKGCIMGGITHADQGLMAKVLGSDAYVFTPVSAGRCPLAKAQLAKFNKDSEHLQQQHTDIMTQIAEPPKQLNPEQLQELEVQLQQIQQELQKLRRKSNTVRSAIDLMADAHILASSTLFPNVKISINGSEILSKNKRGRTLLGKVGNAIGLLKE